MFGIFGLQPALGRLLTPDDDLTPGAHPVAVLSYDYWTRRFGRDPGVLGKTFRIRQIGAGNMGNDRFEIVGVAPQGFTRNGARRDDRRLSPGHDERRGDQ